MGYLSMCIYVSKSLQVFRYEKHWLYALEVLLLFCSKMKNNLSKSIPKAAKDMHAQLRGILQTKTKNCGRFFFWSVFVFLSNIMHFSILFKAA